MAYATRTSVSSDITKMEIERIVKKHGAKSYIAGWENEGMAAVAFELAGRRMRFRIALATTDDKRIKKTDNRGNRRKPEAIARDVEQMQRTTWRALLLVIKAKLESVAQGIETTEEAFLAQIVVPTPNGASTMSEWATPIIARAYAKGEHMPPMLPGMPAPPQRSLPQGDR